MTNGLNRNQLKYLVVIAMLIDHVAWAFVPTATPLAQVMHFIGRLTGATMAFFLAEGYLHTRNVGKYALRLGIFALISWVPYSLFEANRWPSHYLPVIYTLFLGLLNLILWDRTRVPKAVKVLGTVLLCMLSLWGDWPVFDILWPMCLVLWKDEPKKKWTAFLLVCFAAYLYVVSYSFTLYGICNLGVFVVPLLLIFCYNGEPGSRKPFHKWFFYVFYPLHLFLLYLVRYIWMYGW